MIQDQCGNAIVVLAMCPEWPIYSSSTTAHILTVALGGLVLLVPMRLLVLEIVLSGSDVPREAAAFGTAREWMSLMGGIIVILLVLWPAATKTGRLWGHIHIPMVVFKIAHLFVAYAVLGAPLGFAGRLKNSVQNARAEM
jgi:hypothetical protein